MSASFYVEKMLSHIAERSWTAFPMGKGKKQNMLAMAEFINFIRKDIRPELVRIRWVGRDWVWVIFP